MKLIVSITPSKPPLIFPLARPNDPLRSYHLLVLFSTLLGEHGHRSSSLRLHRALDQRPHLARKCCQTHLGYMSNVNDESGNLLWAIMVRSNASRTPYPRIRPLPSFHRVFFAIARPSCSRQSSQFSNPHGASASTVRSH